MAYEVLLQPRARKEFLALPPHIVKTITQHFTRLSRSHDRTNPSNCQGAKAIASESGTIASSMRSTIRPERSSCIVSSIAEKPIDSLAETWQGSPAHGGQSSSSFPCIVPSPSPPTNLVHIRGS